MKLLHKTNVSPFTNEGETNKKETDDKSMSVELKEFAENTSAHGVAGVVKERTTVGKTIWMIIFITACIANTVHLSLLIRRYLRYPTQEVTTVRETFFISDSLCCYK